MTPSEARAGGARWVEPELVAEISFAEWTSDGQLRHPVFVGLREVKEAKQVVRERPGRGKGKTLKGGATVGVKMRARPSVRTAGSGDADDNVAGVRITHPERVVFKEMGVTKLEIARYYEAVWDFIAPYVVDRPLSIVRCPAGNDGECFYQKHLDAEEIRGLRFIPVKESKGVGRYAAVTELAGLIYLVQVNALELHGWQSKADDIELADQLVFDLDPGEKMPWSRVAEGARDVRAALKSHGLESFVKTTGGKGLHVVAPITPGPSWERVKEFCHQLALEMEAREPAKYIANMSKAKRAGKIFVDYLRNQRGATSVLAFSTRARMGATVSVPVEWGSIGRVRADSFHVGNVLAHLKRRKANPWENFAKIEQTLR